MLVIPVLLLLYLWEYNLSIFGLGGQSIRKHPFANKATGLIVEGLLLQLLITPWNTLEENGLK